MRTLRKLTSTCIVSCYNEADLSKSLWLTSTKKTRLSQGDFRKSDDSKCFPRTHEGHLFITLWLCDIIFCLLQTSSIWIKEVTLTLLAPGGAHCAPPATYLRISVQIRIRARWKNLTFLSYEFGKGQYTFYPVKLSRFLKKKIKFVGNTKIS